MSHAPQEQPRALPIRRGMDVYSAYQDQYIGSVIAIWQGGSTIRAALYENGPRAQAVQEAPALSHGEEARVFPAEQVGNSASGEELGPFSTQVVGNSGPLNQSAACAYATVPATDQVGVVRFAVRPGRLNPFARPLYIPTTAVHSISMERIVLKVQQDQIPDKWRA